MSTSEVPFKIAVSDEDIVLLKQKLALTRLSDELGGAGWDYGVPLADIQRLLARWRDGYDWRKAEAALNEELPQFTRDIDVEGHGSLNIHYVHKKSTVEGAIPLLFVHGWPGSFYEVRKILPLLTSPPKDQPAFHVVAFSLPGFGFSEAPSKPGFKAIQYAEVGNKLMLALGYNEYVTQGGDWGYLVTRTIASLYGGKHSKAWHTNMPIAGPPSFLKQPLLLLSLIFTPHTELDKIRSERWKLFQKTGQGYSAEQGTQPQTLGYSLADSPVGLLAWIYEKLVNWTDNYPWDDDEVLTWISIYWFSRAGPAASLRIYYEARNEFVTIKKPSIPLGISYFPKELVYIPRKLASNVGNVVFESEHTGGGHFAAHEKPEELANDLRKMFAKDRAYAKM